jgi:hypothetical protein
MEYFGSVALLVVVSSPVLADLPKIIGPSLFPCMMTFVVPIFDDVPFCLPLNSCRYMPPVGLVDLCGRIVQQS